MKASEVVPEKTPSPIFVTLAGMLTVVSAAALLKAYIPMLVTPSGIVMDVSEDVCANA